MNPSGSGVFVRNVLTSTHRIFVPKNEEKAAASRHVIKTFSTTANDILENGRLRWSQNQPFKIYPVILKKLIIAFTWNSARHHLS